MVDCTCCGPEEPGLNQLMRSSTMTRDACIRNAAKDGPAPIAELLRLSFLRREIDMSEALSVLA